MSDDITIEKVQALITRAPYHQWLGLQVLALDDDGIDLKATWREEWVVSPDRRYTHGGILAALVDLAADWALVKRMGRGVPTIDLRVDYHAAAMPGDLTVKGRVVRAGGQFSCAEAHVYDFERQAARERARHLFHRPAPAAESVIWMRSIADFPPPPAGEVSTGATRRWTEGG